MLANPVMLSIIIQYPNINMLNEPRGNITITGLEVNNNYNNSNNPLFCRSGPRWRLWWLAWPT
jgi:hypothetical protein